MRTYLIICFLFIGCNIFSQTIIKGNLKGIDQAGIFGANIFIEGTYDGTSSNDLGYFIFQTQEKGDHQIQISYLGYETILIPINLIDKDTIFIKETMKETGSEMELVTINAGSFEASDEKKSVLLRPLDIVTTAGATADIAGALNTLPGTSVVGETGQLFVRGGASYETNTMIDGLYVQNPYSSSVPNIPARNRFSPFLFKGTTFSTGAYSAEYGQALSSALILHTQDLAPETQTSVSLMSVGLGLSHTQRWKNTSISLATDYTNLAPYVNLVPQNINWKKAPHGESAQLIFRQKTSATGMLKIQGSMAYNGFQLEYPLADNSKLKSNLNLANSNYYLNSTFKEIIAGNWGLQLGFGYNKNEDHIKQAFTLKEDLESTQFRIKLHKELTKHIHFKVGGSWLKNTFGEDYQSSDAAPHYISDLRDDLGSAFMEFDIYWSDKLVSRLGLRGETSSLLNKQYLAPRFSIAYKTGKNAQVSLASGRFQQRPEWEGLRFDLPEGPEVANHYLMNYQFTSNERTFRIETYYKDYRELLLYDSNNGVNNLGNGYAKGIDLFYRDRITFKQTDFWISYSYLDTKRKYRNFPISTTPRFASKHNLSLVYKRWVTPLNAQIGFTYRYASPRYFDNPNTATFQDQQMPAYHDLSFNASFLTQLFGAFTIIHCSISNVLGIDQNFGERYSTTPNEEGIYTSTTIKPPAKRMIFLGIFLSIKKKP